MTSRPPFLPYARQEIDDDDVAAAVEVLRGDWLTTGPAVDGFEAALKGATGARFAVACSSGTAALHLAALASDLGPGDVAIVPTITFLATANAARYVGADVVFADVDADTGLMTEETLSAALGKRGSPRRVAVLPVHLAGQMVDPEMVARVAEPAGAIVLEDACHALGSTFTGANGRRQSAGDGAHSAMATFSFHPAKTVTSGEGGAVVTNDEACANRLRCLRNHGMTRDAVGFTCPDQAFDERNRPHPWYYEMAELGYNYRITDLQCALGASQLRKLDVFVKRRRQIARRYDERIGALAPVVQPLARVAGCSPAWHLYVVLIDFAAAGVTRDEVMRRLTQAGIGTQVHYIPVHRQPYYRALYGDIELPGAERFYARALSLPMFAGMSAGDADHVVDALERILKR